ncbi:DNA-binding transcriptional regulator, MarR family [Abditibacterium utsteinense]|uniref:DNA-binding transcriptional regulator, MarR family n=1 Tax=Abditibacterium utsteinense TaxID=1960156 RepID=A0A2S8SUD4_9BACT|nr:MarR family transcriptional regulator [Abditibacterium utsteinense]PQV64417.1 DNA-binding transcriptional regulator, MarR family [Abditibacterium utsteinense]
MTTDEDKVAGELSDRTKFLKSASPALEQFMTRMGPCPLGDSRENISLTGAMMCQIMMINSVIERRGNRLLEEHGLTLPQWLALGCISHAGEGGITHSQIGQRLMLSKAPITGTVDRLERAGLVERRGDARDRRVSLAVVTPKGIETWWNVKNTLRGETDELVVQCLSNEEQETLLRLIGRLMDVFSSTHDGNDLLTASPDLTNPETELDT